MSQAHDAALGNTNEVSKETQTRLEEEQEPAGPRVDSNDLQNRFKGLFRQTCVLHEVRILLFCHFNVAHHIQNLFHDFCDDKSFPTRVIEPAAQHASLPLCELTVCLNKRFVLLKA